MYREGVVVMLAALISTLPEPSARHRLTTSRQPPPG